MKPMNDKHFAILRRHMVDVIEIYTDLLEEELGKSAFEKRILTTLLRVPATPLCAGSPCPRCVSGYAVPIGFEKTISQPFMCALMTDLLAPERHETVLEVGTGLGYQTAILSELADHVWSVEIVEEFADSAQAVLASSVTPTSAFGSGTDRVAGLTRPIRQVIVSAAAEPARSAARTLKPTGRLAMPLAPRVRNYSQSSTKMLAGSSVGGP